MNQQDKIHNTEEGPESQTLYQRAGELCLGLLSLLQAHSSPPETTTYSNPKLHTHLCSLSPKTSLKFQTWTFCVALVYLRVNKFTCFNFIFW